MLRKLLVTGAMAALAVGGVNLAPASAAPEAVVINGNATVTPGLYVPGAGAPATGASWTITSGTVDASGSVSGNCGLSNGNGSGRVGSHDVTITRWVGVGGTIVLTATVTNHPHQTEGVAIVQARALGASADPLVIPCVTHAATNFTVIGAATITA